MPTLLVATMAVGTRRAFARQHGSWWRERGVRLVLAEEDLGDEDRTLFDDCLPLPPYDRPEQVLAALEAYAARHAIDAILAQSEYGLLPATLLRRRIACPGLSPEAALACTSKWASRRRLAAAGVPVPAFALVEDAAGVRRFAENGAGWPVVLKAVASTMARNVTRVERAADVDAAVERVKAGIAVSPDVRRLVAFARMAGLALDGDPLRQFLVEECIDGAPAETDGIVRDGRSWTFGVIEQRWMPPPFPYLDGYLFPADPAFADVERVRRVSDEAVAASGIADGGFAVEMRVRARDDVRVIEVNGRLGEDDGFPRLFEASLGIHPLRECVAALAGIEGAGAASGRPGAELPERRPCALAFANHVGAGIVREVPSDEDLDRAPGSASAAASCAGGGTGRVLEVRRVVERGTHLFAPPHPDVFPHVLYALAEHPAGSRAAYALARAALDRLRVRVEPGP